MAQRPGIQLTVDKEADGGVSPNRFVPLISAHVRLYWPALATQSEVESALEEAYVLVLHEFRDRYGA